jgi:hypothetical protein
MVILRNGAPEGSNATEMFARWATFLRDCCSRVVFHHMPAVSRRPSTRNSAHPCGTCPNKRGRDLLGVDTWFADRSLDNLRDRRLIRCSREALTDEGVEVEAQPTMLARLGGGRQRGKS